MAMREVFSSELCVCLCLSLKETTIVWTFIMIYNYKYEMPKAKPIRIQLTQQQSDTHQHLSRRVLSQVWSDEMSCMWWLGQTEVYSSIELVIVYYLYQSCSCLFPPPQRQRYLTDFASFLPHGPSSRRHSMIEKQKTHFHQPLYSNTLIHYSERVRGCRGQARECVCVCVWTIGVWVSAQSNNTSKTRVFEHTNTSIRLLNYRWQTIIIRKKKLSWK